MKDHPVRLPGDGGDPAAEVLLVDPDRAHQDVEAPALRGDLDAAVDDVDEEEALVLVREGDLVAPPEDDADHLFEAVGERPGGSVWHEAELADRQEHALAGLGAAAEAVQYPGHGCDRDARAGGDVVDRQRPLGLLRLCHYELSASWIRATGSLFKRYDL